LESKKISVKELLKAMPDGLLVRLSYFTDVDYQVKKLYGRNVFYLLLFGLLESTRISLRSLEDIYNSRKFRYLFNLCHSRDAKYNSISDRLKTMEVSYFEEIYKCVFSIFSDLYSDKEAIKYKIVRVDSTMVAEAANKLEKGMRTGGKTNKNQIKYTINLNNLFPSSVAFYTEQKYLSDDLAIHEAIIKSIDKSKDNVFVFDRGMRSRAKYIELDQNHYRFVTRINYNAKHEVVKANPLVNGLCVNNLRVISDEMVFLYERIRGKLEHPFRLIKARNDNKELWFLTNQLDLSVEEIISIYRKRWDIEVFFRFLKQEMNITHFISTNLNGIKIVLYMTLIAAMLILVYKRLNDIGYKTAKRRFTMELDDLISIILIKICGGDPSLVFR